MKEINNIYESILSRGAAVSGGVQLANDIKNIPRLKNWLYKYCSIKAEEEYIEIDLTFNNNATSIIFDTTPPVKVSKSVVRFSTKEKPVSLAFKNMDIEDLSWLDFIETANINSLSFYDCKFTSLKGADLTNISGRFLIKNCPNLSSLEGMPRNAKYVTIINCGTATDKGSFDYKDIKKYCNVSKSNCIWG